MHGGPGDLAPQPRRGAADLGGERPLDLHRVVVLRACVLRVIALLVVVDDVDAADKGKAAVDRGKLAVHAAQPVAPQGNLHHAAEDQHARPRALQRLEEARRKIARAEAVDQQVRGHAARRRARERIGNQAAGLVVGEDVRLEEHLLARPVDGRHERREVLLAVLQKGKAVAGRVLQAAL